MQSWRRRRVGPGHALARLPFQARSGSAAGTRAKRLFFSDKNLVVQGRVFVGFPLLVHSDGNAVVPAQSFLWDVLTTNGRARAH